MSARLAGHGLVAEGRVWVVGSGRAPQNGEGRGVCGCGAESPMLGSTRQRRQWHREHKADIHSARGLASMTATPRTD